MKKPHKSELRSVLEEEQNRLKDLSVLYEEKICNLPKGHISIKRINDHDYAYLSFREKEKIRSIYIGKPSSDAVDKMKGQIESRKEYKSKLRAVKEKLKELKRILNRKKFKHMLN